MTVPTQSRGWIAFEASRGEDDQLHVIDAGGGNETAITDATNPDDDREHAYDSADDADDSSEPQQRFVHRASRLSPGSAT